ncbi:MAG TPA: hypothetical protein VN019_00745, partial [Oxalicibacterium sp.]|nr:hypothetical protein [Oxalicibacterium sp.]
MQAWQCVRHRQDRTDGGEAKKSAVIDRAFYFSEQQARGTFLLERTGLGRAERNDGDVAGQSLFCIGVG